MTSKINTLLFLLLLLVGCSSPTVKRTPQQPTIGMVTETPVTGKTDQPILFTSTPTFATTYIEKMLVNGNQGIIVLNPDGTDVISVRRANGKRR